MELYYWLIAFAVLLVIEVFTLGLTTIWFAAGSLVAFIAGSLGANLAIQIGLFVVVSVVLLIFTRPLARKYFNKSRVQTNVASLTGQEGVVIEAIDTLKAQGRVSVKGQEWAARTRDSAGLIAVDKTIVIEGVEGVHLIVKEREENE